VRSRHLSFRRLNLVYLSVRHPEPLTDLDSPRCSFQRVARRLVFRLIWVSREIELELWLSERLRRMK
jgi:hypothetical protein